MCNGFIRKDNWDIYGNDLEQSVYVSDYAECCTKCQHTQGCQAFAYAPSTGECWPKAHIGDGGRPAEDRVTGYNRKYLLAKKRAK